MTRSPRRRALGQVALVLLTAFGANGACDPVLPDVPYACGQSGLCPDGFTCEESVCVRDGVQPAETRPMRVAWINAAEMYWFDAPDGGADLVVIDGFTVGGRALYEMHVSPEGAIEGPSVLLDFGEEFPTSTAVVALDAAHYGVLTMTFPPVTSSEQVVSFYSLDRGKLTDQSSTPPLATRKLDYLGGAEPAYVGAVRREGGAVDVAYGDPNAGGKVVFARIQDGTWQERFQLDLPAGVLPLSADCLLWDVGDGIMLRLGLESPQLFYVPDAALGAMDIEGPLTVPGLPVFGFNGSVLTLLLDDAGENATYRLVDYDGAPIGPELGGAMQPTLEPHTGWPYGDGALVAPLSSDASFTSLGVAYVTAAGLTPVGSFERTGSDELYSARAFVKDGRVYLAWTSFHDALMDLWVATFPSEGLE